MSEHWHPQKRLATLGDLNPSQPDEGFLSIDHFGLPGEDVPEVFEATFGMPLPSFYKKVNLLSNVEASW